MVDRSVALALLKEAVFDEKRSATHTFLSRRTGLCPQSAARMLKQFYDAEKDTHLALNAVFVLSGRLISEPSMHKLQTVREADLEKAQAKYAEDTLSCEIFSVQDFDVKSLHDLYSDDALDEEQYIDKDIACSFLGGSSLAEKGRQIRERTLSLFSSTSSSEQSGTSKKVPAVGSSKVDDLKKATAAISIKTTKPLFAKSTSKPVSEASSKPSASRPHVSVTKSRQTKIKFDNECDSDAAETEECTVVEEKTKTKTPQKSMKPELMNSTQDDLFSTGSSPSPPSSPEKPVKRESRTRTAKGSEKDSKRRDRKRPLKSDSPAAEMETDSLPKDNKSENGSSPAKGASPSSSGRSSQGKRTMLRQEHANETFCDDDGFLVTKEVVKRVEVEVTDSEPTPKPAVDASHKNQSAAKTSAPQKKATAPKNQTKISNFFTRNSVPSLPEKTSHVSAAPVANATVRKMTVNEVVGDLFKGPEGDVALAHCISEDCRMGKGIAVMFKKEFGGVDQLKQQVQNARARRTYAMLFTSLPSNQLRNGAEATLILGKVTGTTAVLKRGDRYVYYLITKKRYSDKPTYSSLENSLDDMRKHMVAHGVSRLAMPRIGCGLDGLQWDQVKTIVDKVFVESDIQVTVYSLK